MLKKLFKLLRFSALMVAFIFLILPLMFFSVINKSVKKAKNILGIKGKEAVENDGIFMDNQAWADIPFPPPNSTPFLAVWDGTGYKIENDVLFSSNDNYSSSLTKAKIRYESGFCGPDLYRIKNNPKISENGEIRFQIQEQDPEESFIDYLKIFQVVHGKNTEILVDSDYQNFHVIEKNKIENAILPEEILVNGKVMESGKVFGKSFLEESSGIRLHYRQNASIGFKGLDPNKSYNLILKVKERGWSPVAKTLFTIFPAIKYLTLAFAGLVSPWLYGGVVSILPFIMLLDGNRSINLYYKNRGFLKFFGSVHPRMKESVESVSIPDKAISADGELNLNLEWTRTHHLVSIGLIDFVKTENQNYEIEELELVKAFHNENKSDYASLLTDRNLNYLHTVQGDIVDLVFRSTNKNNKNNHQYTYLLSAGGFYTDLRPQYQRAFKNLMWLAKEEFRA